eukprot:2438996-Pleurochrysis_carterae.AAC.3
MDHDRQHEQDCLHPNACCASKGEEMLRQHKARASRFVLRNAEHLAFGCIQTSRRHVGRLLARWPKLVPKKAATTNRSRNSHSITPINMLSTSFRIIPNARRYDYLDANQGLPAQNKQLARCAEIPMVTLRKVHALVDVSMSGTGPGASR